VSTPDPASNQNRTGSVPPGDPELITLHAVIDLIERHIADCPDGREVQLWPHLHYAYECLLKVAQKALMSWQPDPTKPEVATLVDQNKRFLESLKARATKAIEVYQAQLTYDRAVRDEQANRAIARWSPIRIQPR
jgi:hypothetical protein